MCRDVTEGTHVAFGATSSKTNIVSLDKLNDLTERLFCIFFIKNR